jgi:hypothetical protein
MCSIFVPIFKLHGIIISQTLTNFLNVALLCYYMKTRDIIPKISVDKLFLNYKNYIYVTLPIALPAAIDFICFEANSLIVGSF